MVQPGAQEATNASGNQGDVLVLHFRCLEDEDGEQDAEPEGKNGYRPVVGHGPGAIAAEDTEGKSNKEEDDEVPEFGSLWVQEVVADHGDEASDDRTDQEGNHEWKETRSVEAHDEANDDEDGATEWSNHGHVFLKWNVLDVASFT